MTIPEMNLPWVDSPFFEQIFNQLNLDNYTREIVKQFAEQGYVIIDDLGIENISEIVDRIVKDLTPIYGEKGKVKSAWIYHDRIQDAWTFNQDVKKIATAPHIINLLKILYQREPIPFQTLNFRFGTEQSTHSDSIHFSSVPARFMCGVWVALEDIDANNGPLHYYPGSHKLPIFDLNDLGITGSYQNKPYDIYPVYEEFLQSLIEYNCLKKVELYVKKGQALIWAANLLHGGSPVLDKNRTRYSQVTHYYFSDCMYYIPLLSDPFLCRVHFKEVKNIITGEVVNHVYNKDKIEINPEEYEIEKLKYQLLQFEEELVKLRPIAMKSQDELNVLKPQLQTVESELEKLRSRLYDSQAELGLLKSQNQLLETELKRLRIKLYQNT
ncbi:MAG: phytanoyl-CoA dioxygenase family protein [Trichodesmium sp. St16_bin4-tuft]|nr:phytanoyl-CoA dioxygenase family protein [Trichodesmium sp. MAG_R01]MDE5070714.1 phytanoyl-CoA dioxygenase family protein [Trichodesmium sp. St5_bin8]MDE5092477.1 phytanoyl-CoA dioxygenase family protein [Trichodesmium sp. St18_bin3_1_1]MDE5101236.1 phytanoyl-CoA dioxygenase family protein [Trichodesmium sp. St16_bin4-tuft]MDE5103621.1 phytanoyl-CoA dioxygenase family protein [Trichodesmium sp. St19_bin2]